MSDKERSDEGSSYEEGSDEESIDEITDGLKRVEISKEQHTQHTPEKERKGGVRDRASINAQKKLDFPSTNENDKGEWLENHPWNDEEPDLKKDMDSTIYASLEYSAGSEYETGEGKNKKVDLKKIYSDLPKFITKRKGQTSREDLEHLLDNILILYQVKGTAANAAPHITEIVHKKRGVKPTDKPSPRPETSKPETSKPETRGTETSKPETSKSDAKFKAFSLPSDEENQLEPSEQSYWYLDCEYMLKMWLTPASRGWFNYQEGNLRIRESPDAKKNSRWIFTPSYRRAEIALLDWPKDNIVTPDSTIRILVVRPSEFDDYVKYCGYKFPVISLPQDEIGAGYPRFWIQKIALRLKLDFIWMIDDSVEWFCEYHPTVLPPEPDGSRPKEGRYLIRRRQFGKVLERIEQLVKKDQDQDEDSPIAAMSPKRFDMRFPLKKAFVCKPPRIAVFLNLKALESKHVFYRPELQTYEDMIFGYECEQNGLKVFIHNRIHLQDHRWKDTGARSPYIEGNQDTAAANP